MKFLKGVFVFLIAIVILVGVWIYFTEKSKPVCYD